MKKSRMLVMLGLVLTLLLTAMPALAADPNPGNGNTDVVVVNTNQNTADPPAAVTALYYEPGGNLDYSRPRNINPRGSYTFLASDTPLGDGWTGHMILQSDYELAAIAEITWSDGDSNDGITAGAYRGYASGATEMYLPFVVYAPNAQFTRVTVQNTEDAAATIKMEYINRDGTTDFTITDSISGLGSKTYDMHLPGGKVPDFTTTSYYQNQCNAGFCNWGGALKITSLNGKEIAAVATNHWRHWAVAYNGSASGAEKNFIPSAERRVNAGTDWRGFSVAIAQCVESTLSCNVQIQYVNAVTGNVDLTLNRTLNPGAALGANTRNGGDWTFNDFAVLGDAWVGSIIVRTTNGTKITVIAYTIRPGTTVAGSTSGANIGDAGTATFLPAIYQIGPSCPPGNDWVQFSLIRIQNPNTVDANDVDIYYFNPDGSLAFQELNFSIPAEKSMNRNTRVHCQDIQLGQNWTGSVYIASDQPVVAVAETLWGGTKMNAYNGYSITP